MSNITQALTRLFERHRIVFWYDARRELRADYEALALPDVTKITLHNNEFAVKYRLLRVERDQKFLLYCEGAQPPDEENWLLDVQLAQGEFRADQISLWLSELGLEPRFWDVLQEHAPFFKKAAHRTALRALLPGADTAIKIRLRMLGVCAGLETEPRLEDVLELLLAELAAGKENLWALIQHSQLDGFFWEQLGRLFNYHSATPGIKDFTITLFKACYTLGLGEKAPLNTEALVFLRRWKDSVRFSADFKTLSAMSAQVLNIEGDLHRRELADLAAMDMFSLIDQRILSELVTRLVARTISSAECLTLIRQRRASYWYATYADVYEALGASAQFFSALDEVELTINSLAEGVQKYARTWYQLDQRYRKALYHAGASQQVSLLQPLVDQVEKLYSNRFLLKVNDNWQQVVDRATRWEAPPIPAQQEFYAREVEKYVQGRAKVAVIISDALRYEVAEELVRRIQGEDRYDAELAPWLSCLPSYTQLGMAALLPHHQLTLKPGDRTVWVDGQSAAGTENRAKILAQATGGAATAVQASQLLALNRDDSRALLREHQVIYVYHDQIDAVGHKRDTEERTFQAVEQALRELVEIIKKLTNANATNILITADHGFVYQHRALEESDFAGAPLAGLDVIHQDRRFVLGRDLEHISSLRAWEPEQLGISADCRIYIAKSINRLRLQGAASRFVHGGAALQEVVVPVIHINKKRESDLSQVEVEIIGSPSSIISSGQLSITLYQSQPVSGKIQPRDLRAGIVTLEGELISDAHDLRFDFTSENPREREVKVRLVLSQRANAANGKTVLLRLDEPVAGTTHYQPYKSARYVLQRAFTSDFDL